MTTDVMESCFMHRIPGEGRRMLMERFGVTSQYLGGVLNFKYFSFNARHIRHVAINELGCEVFKKIKCNPSQFEARA